MEIGWT